MAGTGFSGSPLPPLKASLEIFPHQPVWHPLQSLTQAKMDEIMKLHPLLLLQAELDCSVLKRSQYGWTRGAWWLHARACNSHHGWGRTIHLVAVEGCLFATDVGEAARAEGRK